MSLFRTIVLLQYLLDLALSLTDLSIGSAYRTAGTELSAALPYVADGHEAPWTSQEDVLRPSTDDEVLAMQDAEGLLAEQIPPAQMHRRPAFAWDEHVPPASMNRRPAWDEPLPPAHMPSEPFFHEASHGTVQLSGDWQPRLDPTVLLHTRPGNLGVRWGELDGQVPLEASMQGFSRGQDTSLALARVTEAAATLEQDAAMLSGQLQLIGEALQQNPSATVTKVARQYAGETSLMQASQTPTATTTPLPPGPAPVGNGTAAPDAATATKKSSCPLANKDNCGRFMKFFTLNYELDVGWAVAHWTIVILFWCFFTWCCCKCCFSRRGQ